MNKFLFLKKKYFLYIKIYTDGSCLGNPGIGGYAIIIKTYYYNKYFLVGKFLLTTNNRMELKAIINAIIILKKYFNYYFIVYLFTDSKYVINSINNKNIIKWYNNNFKKIKNSDLWLKLININIYKEKILFFWIKSHFKNINNIKCNNLAKKATKNKKIIIDYKYVDIKKKKIYIN
ncbi:MAG: ribonuclease HI [Candidatus Shikimatogenerans sp. JK-2022]|nr:ribonuclease HI [Candidatus Shikimatogenerans bostrichidophilus]